MALDVFFANQCQDAQNLKIKFFLGTSKNAVLTQIWVAMCYVE
jgi:hypothetical protein